MMYNAMTPCVNYVGPKAENAPFVILRKLSREVMTTQLREGAIKKGQKGR